MKRALFLFGMVASAGMLAAQAQAADILIGGHLFLAKAAGLVKVLSKDGTLMAGTGDPTVSGATLNVFDEGDGTNYSLNLASTGWSGSAGSFKYKGAGSGSDPCKIVILKPGLLKAVCKGLSPIPTVPFVGDAGIKLTIATDNYCLSFPLASAKKNTDKLVKILDATAPGSCPTPFMAMCPMAPGQYTVTQTSGGFLSSYTFLPYAFPSGGTIIEDVAAASLPDCVHNVVVKFPGGFSSPNFCVPGLGLSVSVTQTACGAGKIDSNGGSDFDTLEVADTSNTGAPCALPNVPCTNGTDASSRVDVTVGNGSPDTCTSGTANSLVSVPVATHSWADMSGGVPVCAPCAGDCVFNGADVTAAQFNQILDFTTATAAGHWADIDGDGCSIAGVGPTAGYAVGKCADSTTACTLATEAVDCAAFAPAATCRGVGTCIDLTKVGMGTTAVTTTAQGQFGATGGLFDGSFTVTLPSKIDNTGAFMGDTCGSPPVITYGGTATRCIP
jgi:hypothetical protein